MRKITLILSVLAFCLLMLPAQDSQAFTGIKNNWLAEYPDVCQDLVDIANDCSLCHGGGFSLNPYSQDLLDASLVFADIEAMDSDGDGRTNIEEIGTDCTAPGDAVSPVEAATWTTIKTLFE